MQEGDALVAVVDPEQRRADALGQQQADGAAEKRAEHVGDRGVAQLPLEDHRQHAPGRRRNATLMSGSAPSGRSMNAEYATAPINKSRASMNQAMNERPQS